MKKKNWIKMKKLKIHINLLDKLYMNIWGG